MIRQLTQFLRRHPDYFLLSTAILLSSTGSALTIVAVYGELGKRDASPLYYSLAFVLATIPGLFTSHLAGKIIAHIRISTAMIAMECLGATALLFPLLGLQTGALWFFLLTEFFSSAIMGFLVPLQQTFIRHRFSDRELKLVSIYSTYMFSANFIFGQALGTIFYVSLGTGTYLLLDLFSYLIASYLIWQSAQIQPEGFESVRVSERVENKFQWRAFSPLQKHVFLLMPTLALCCAPAMSLLPAIGARYGVDTRIGNLAISPILIFLLLRTLGQMSGPYVVKPFNFDRLIQSRTVLVGCIATYLLLYLIIFSTTSFLLACVCIVFAHLASNVIFILSSYGLSKCFSVDTVGAVSARQYQITVLVMSLSALWGGLVAEVSSVTLVIYLSSIGLAVTIYRFTQFPLTIRKENYSAECAPLE